MPHLGELAALATAIFWTVTALAFESAAKQIGTFMVNILRLLLGFVLISVFTFFYRGIIFPVDATAENWIWLTISGLIGFVFGDLFLVKAFQTIGSRVSMLVMALVPPIAAFAGWVLMGETMSLSGLLGMALTMIGIAVVVLERKTNEETERKQLNFSYSIKGLLFAFGGAVGQSIGLVFSKRGMGAYNPFAATQIRLIAGIIGFSVLISFLGKWKNLPSSLKNRVAMRNLSIGSVFGPFLGVSFSLISVQHTSSGIASTIMALVPVLIIVPAIFIYKEKVTGKEIIGALLSVSGVALFFWI